jgi:hypothetical protein
MSKLHAFGLATVLASSLCNPSAQAQDPYRTNYYEQGVSAFFSGHCCQAETPLSLAIAANSQDPRGYYFRAFCLLRQGRTAEAQGDMLVGATLEAQQPGRYAVGMALERVQGSDRLMLEQFRRNARRDAAIAATAAPAEKPTTFVQPRATTPPQNNSLIRPGEAEVLREEKRVVPLDELLRPGGPEAIAAEPPVEEPSAAPKGTAPAAKPAAEATDPFADDSSASEPKATTPPVPPQDTPKPTPPTTNPPAEEGDNPFGG